MIIKMLFQEIPPDNRTRFYGFSTSRAPLQIVSSHISKISPLIELLPFDSFTLMDLTDDQLYFYYYMVSIIIEETQGSVPTPHWSGVSLSTWFFETKMELIRRDLW